MEALTLWLAWNLYQQRALAWKVAVGWVVFGWLSVWATVARYGFAGMYRVMGYSEAELTPILPFVKYGIGFGALFAVAFLVFLLATRKHFMSVTAMPSAV